MLHVLSAVIWVGGMFFAYVCLRPVAASQLEPPQRLQLWLGVFAKFFPFVWASIILLPLTGFLMIFSIWKSMAATPLYVHLMLSMGIVMIFIYLHAFFSPYKKLKLAISAQDWPLGGKALGQMRTLVGVNLIIGITVVLIATAGRYLIF